MKKVPIEKLKQTVEVIKRPTSDGPVNANSTNDGLRELPEFKMAPGMVNGSGEVINPEEQR